MRWLGPRFRRFGAASPNPVLPPPPLLSLSRRFPVAFLSGFSRVFDPLPASQLLALIGEQFPDPGEICGAVVNVRNKGDRISIWTRTGGNEAAQMAVGKCMKQVLDLNETTRLGYMLHDDAIKLDRKAKDRYTV
jgi:hypothetical protein